MRDDHYTKDEINQLKNGNKSICLQRLKDTLRRSEYRSQIIPLLIDDENKVWFTNAIKCFGYYQFIDFLSSFSDFYDLLRGETLQEKENMFLLLSRVAEVALEKGDYFNEEFFKQNHFSFSSVKSLWAEFVSWHRKVYELFILFARRYADLANEITDLNSTKHAEFLKFCEQLQIQVEDDTKDFYQDGINKIRHQILSEESKRSILTKRLETRIALLESLPYAAYEIYNQDSVRKCIGAFAVPSMLLFSSAAIAVGISFLSFKILLLLYAPLVIGTGLAGYVGYCIGKWIGEAYTKFEFKRLKEKSLADFRQLKEAGQINNVKDLPPINFWKKSTKQIQNEETQIAACCAPTQ